MNTMLDWATADVGFTPRQLDTAAAVVEKLQPVELAFLAGSLSVGLGHGTSDIDLHVVGDGLGSHPYIETYDGVAVQVNPIGGDLVRQVIELGREYRASGTDRSQLLAEEWMLSALTRLVNARRLSASAEFAAEFDSLDVDVVRQILIARWANLYWTGVEDVYGALRTRDRFSAVTASDYCLAQACEAVAVACGDLYIGEKFLFRRLARNPVSAPWVDRLWRLAHQEIGPTTDVRALVKERLRASSLLLTSCVLDGWDRPLTALSDPAETEDGTGPRRSPYFTPVQFTDGLALIGPEAGYEVSEPMLRLWRDCDGRPVAPELASAIGDLHAVGAVDLGEPQPENATGAPPATTTANLMIRRADRFTHHALAEG